VPHTDPERATQWASSFDDRARDDGARMFAFLGLAEGALGRARE